MGIRIAKGVLISTPSKRQSPEVPAANSLTRSLPPVKI